MEDRKGRDNTLTKQLTVAFEFTIYAQDQTWQQDKQRQHFTSQTETSVPRHLPPEICSTYQKHHKRYDGLTNSSD